MYAESVRVTLNPQHNFTALTLATALRGFSSFTGSECLYIARCMLKGEGWEPEPCSLNLSDLDAVSPNFYWGWFNFRIEMPPCPYKDQEEKWKAQRAILEKGAAGDAEAAIAYCKMELNYEINHGAMG